MVRVGVRVRVRDRVVRVRVRVMVRVRVRSACRAHHSASAREGKPVVAARCSLGGPFLGGLGGFGLVKPQIRLSSSAPGEGEGEG